MSAQNSSTKVLDQEDNQDNPSYSSNKSPKMNNTMQQTSQRTYSSRFYEVMKSHDSAALREMREK